MDIEELQVLVTKFRDKRDWKQFHTPKNLAQAMASEVGELNDLYLWDRQPTPFDVGKELADIFIYLLSMAEILGLDLADAVIRKLNENEGKYSIIKSKGNDRKQV